MRVTFNDDQGNEESVTSEATAAVAARPNTPATGTPSISGTAQVDETLTASMSGIADPDGLDNVSYSYQWLADDSNIENATNSTYTLAEGDAGKAIRVRVTFTDDAGNEESLTSAATAAVKQPLTASVDDAPESHDGRSAFTFELEFSEEPKTGFSYVTLRDHAFTVTGATVTNTRRLEPGKNDLWEITVQPDGNADVTVSLPATTDCNAQGSSLCQRRQDAVYSGGTGHSGPVDPATSAGELGSHRRADHQRQGPSGPDPDRRHNSHSRL